MEFENRCRTCMRLVKSIPVELTDDLYEFLAQDLGMKSVPKEHPELQLPQIVCSNCNRLIMEFQQFLTKCREVEEYFKTKLEMLSNLSNQENHDDDDDETIYVESINLIPKEEIERTSDCEGMDNDNFNEDDEPIFEISGSESKRLVEETEIKKVKQKTKPKTKGRTKDCSVCGKNFRNFSQLRDHENIHKGIKPHCCDVCGKCFTQRTHLFTHQILHFGKTVECEECGKKFARSSELILHDRVHRDEKPFVCDIEDCKAAFRLRPRLLEHQAKHTGERKFRCDICGHAFFSNNNLCGHKNKVHSKFSYQCDICFLWFPKPVGIRKHMNSSHKIQIEDVSPFKKAKNIEKNVS